MKRNVLGRTGVEVSEMGFGAWAIGGEGDGFNYGDVPEKEALACIETYLDADGNHIDTARYYNESERIIGLILKEPSKREKVFLASKTVQDSEEGIHKELEESLRLLQTDHLDLYYLHLPPHGVAEMNLHLDVFEQLREEGKIRFIGASIKGPDVTPATVDLCRQYIDTGRLDAIQLIYSIFRQKTREIFDHAVANRVGLVGRTALESGFLTGKYAPGQCFSGNDHRQRWAGRLAQVLESAQDLRRTADKPPYETLAQVALRFAMLPDAIGSTIVGAKTVEQTKANLAALDLPPLDQALVGRLVSDYGDRTTEFNGS